ncbi:ATP-binding protein [Spiribacter halobius]|uniref:histidine kinase n=1 Tax=Sediminicurvatus halobius TaxID=2182432 RepID=A0A2U2N9V8_9GAMM|nr:ATP-binding protein [Spiribacter halobius]PWG65754.1 histidine kinase [Spiribacter halobius]UEX77792.1 MASE1 domain-containing protein [Spiribacter halobius]
MAAPQHIDRPLGTGEPPRQPSSGPRDTQRLVTAVHRPDSRLRRLARDLGRHLIVALLLVAGSLWAGEFRLVEPPVPLIWPATAVTLALALRWGPWTLLTAGLTVAAVQLGHGAAPMAAGLMGAGLSLAGAAGRALLLRLDFDPELARLRDVGLFLLAGAGVSGLFNALSGTLALAGLSTGFAETLGLCWIADSMGLLLFGPMLLTARLPAPHHQPLWELPLWLAAMPLVVYLIYGDSMPGAMALPLSYGVFPLVMLAALRHPLPLASLVVSAIAVIAITCTGLGKGPFAGSGMRADMLALHAHLAILALTGLLLAAARHERDRAEARARSHLQALAQAGRLNAMSTMAAGIAHEINQPLCAVSSYAQAARRLLRQGHRGEELEAALERIVSGNQRASDIVRRIRDFLRSGEHARRRCDANTLVTEACELMRPELRRRGVELWLDLDDGSLSIDADPVAIQQAVVNLLQNALEAVSGRATPEERWVLVRSRRNRGRDTVELTFCDSGPGLPAGDTRELFEPMVTQRPDGSGLGLAITRSIVESHDGHIDAGNRPGAGAEFRILLPLREETS